MKVADRVLETVFVQSADNDDVKTLDHPSFLICSTIEDSTLHQTHYELPISWQIAILLYTNDEFNPTAYMTRAQFVASMHRALNILN